MFNYRKFDVPVTRVLSEEGLRWPERGEASDESGLGGNGSYADLRGLSWRDARRVLELETSLIERIEGAADADEEIEQIEDELYEDDEGLYGLDIGIASTVIALCAARCVTCSSCNAGAYGGHHHENHPVVAFFARPYHIELLLSCAEQTSVGLENVDGIVIAFANDIRDMRSFAAALIRDCAMFRAARPKRGNELRTDPPKEAGADYDSLPLFGRRLV